eukprot:CAMPEP_0206435084 /NCGR_PEP_ID=MMETSP0324_2-20121206/9611_1 /ASSEMBLY_ACC=CAM_ASM_000836 /TAXON_ID=2866 /ORGANISM="Crypthecodinium cohnii, Strain Seligo" /LENGTH=59 /DNA_ID=CAMNT_0053901859 /DNA_START=447 /DNA_END=626 /DNA_ORIENTATION=+
MKPLPAYITWHCADDSSHLLPHIRYAQCLTVCSMTSSKLSAACVYTSKQSGQLDHGWAK